VQGVVKVNYDRDFLTIDSVALGIKKHPNKNALSSTITTASFN